jgi:predicted transcriptional regulator
MARRIGISPSYLNLIERNKRRITGPLLLKTAEALGVKPEELDGAAERRLAEALDSVAHLPSLNGHDIEVDATGEFIGRYPGWARATATLARSEQSAWESVRLLSERLSHDPVLGETVHRMLTRIASIRSAADILTAYRDVSPDQRARFNQIILSESEKLTEIGEALASYFDKLEDTDPALTPMDEVENMFVAHRNRFEEIEARAVEVLPKTLDKMMVAGSDNLARFVNDEFSELIEDLVAGEAKIETVAARKRARASLLRYAENALLMPHEAFFKDAVELGHDIELLARRYGVGVDLVCRRLTAAPEEVGVPSFGYLLTNASGTIIELLGLEGLVVPRIAGACPLWALYRAQQMPETIMRQRVLFPNGARFIFVARARKTQEAGFGKPRHFVTDMLVIPEEDARHTVYGPGDALPVEEVGPACRMCPRDGCKHRVIDPLAD